MTTPTADGPEAIPPETNIIRFTPSNGAPSDLGSIRRADFLQTIAESFDLYVERNGYEPDALAYVLTGIKQRSRVGWMMGGESEGAGTAVLSIAQAHLTAEITSRLRPVE